MVAASAVVVGEAVAVGIGGLVVGGFVCGFAVINWRDLGMMGKHAQRIMVLSSPTLHRQILMIEYVPSEV